MGVWDLVLVILLAVKLWVLCSDRPWCLCILVKYYLIGMVLDYYTMLYYRTTTTCSLLVPIHTRMIRLAILLLISMAFHCLYSL